MSDQMFNPQPNYSGVTIQIANPAVNVNPYGAGCSQDGIKLNGASNFLYQQPCYYQDKSGLVSQNRGIIPAQYGVTNPANNFVNQYGVVPESLQSGNGMQNYSDNYGFATSNLSTPFDNAYNSGAQIVPNGQNLKQDRLMNEQTQNNPYYSQYGINGQISQPQLDEQGQYNGFNNGRNGATGQKYQDSGYGQAYPAGYYINNYNIQSPDTKTNPELRQDNNSNRNNAEINNLSNPDNYTDVRNINPEVANQYKDYADSLGKQEPEDMTASTNIISDLDERNAEIREANKNTKETKVFALTDEYIKSLENYLDNPNDELRLMASKEVLTRLDEDKNRYDDAALNALLNKMLQDPSKLVRLAALSAFASQLANGNDYTVQLLQNIQTNPNGDKEDALQAADILLKMSAGVEVKNVPVKEEEKREVYKMKQ